jgi:hypothetical protein
MTPSEIWRLYPTSSNFYSIISPFFSHDPMYCLHVVVQACDVLRTQALQKEKCDKNVIYILDKKNKIHTNVLIHRWCSKWRTYMAYSRSASATSPLTSSRLSRISAHSFFVVYFAVCYMEPLSSTFVSKLRYISPRILRTSFSPFS